MTGIIDRLRAMQGMGDIQLKALMDGVGPQAADEIERLATKLKAAEKERDSTMRLADSLALALNTSNHERDNLRAKIEHMEQQVPICRAEDLKHAESLLPTLGLKPENPLYALPGAKGEEK